MSCMQIVSIPTTYSPRDEGRCWVSSPLLLILIVVSEMNGRDAVFGLPWLTLVFHDLGTQFKRLHT